MVNKEIPVVILCGGKGTRLREETEYKPKPLVKIGRQTDPVAYYEGLCPFWIQVFHSLPGL